MPGRYGLNQRLTAAREARGWTQKELAKRLGIDAKTPSYWENGRRWPRPSDLARLCALLDMSAAELGFGGRGGEAELATGETTEADAPFILPAPVSHFTGRAGEIEALVKTLRVAPPAPCAILISGASGIGKSALAAEVLTAARAIPGLYPRGIVHIPCEGLHGADGLLMAYALLAECWRLSAPEASAPRERPAGIEATWRESGLRARLRFDGRALAAFDGVEPDFPLNRLLGLCAAVGLRALVTSAAAQPSPHVTGYHRLGPLTTSEAVRLFAHAYGASGAPWSAGQDGAATREIVRAVGRVPAAVHMAAAMGRARGLTPERLRHEITRRDAPRHLRDPSQPNGPTLFALYDRLLGALDPALADAFAALGVCEARVIPANVAARLVGAVTDAPQGKPVVGRAKRLHGARLDTLDTLALSSLIRQTWDGGADEPIVILEPLALAIAHDRWRGLDAPRQVAAIAGLVRALERYVAGRTARGQVALLRVEFVLGALRAASQRTLPADCDAPLARLAGAMEAQLAAAGRWDTLRALLITLQRAARRRGRAAGEEARLLAALGGLSVYQGRVDEAARYHQAAIRLATRAGHVASEFDALDGMGTLALLEDRLDDAERDFTRGLRLVMRLQDMSRVARALLSLGDLMARRWRVAEAAGRYTRALGFAREAGDHEAAGYAHMALGHQAFYRGAFMEALGQYRLAGQIAVETENRPREAYALRGLGYAATRLRRLDEAEARLKRAVALSHEVGYALGEADALRWLGDVVSRRGRYDEGEALLDRSERICQALACGTGVAHTLRLRGDLAMRRGEAEAARAAYSGSLAINTRIGDIVGIAEAAIGLGSAAALQGAGNEARAHYGQALERLAPLDYYEARRAQAALGWLSAPGRGAAAGWAAVVSQG